MHRRTSRALMVSVVGLMAFASAAHAERAPITYSGQSGGTSAVATEVASLGASGLAGGAENSYGYGSERRGNDGVIDLRRSNARRSAPVVFEQAPPEEDEDEAEGPMSLTPAPHQTQPPQQQMAQATEPTPQAEQGAQQWLEREQVGPPYQANGQWYVPTPEPGYQQTGSASWYGADFQGRRTASGETFDQAALTAAHPTLPIPSLVQVTNLENGREVIVRVNDRGPFSGDRLIDVSRGAAQVLGFEQAGQARVHVRYLGPAPRRVNADGTPAPESVHAPASAAPRSEEGPRSFPAQQSVETVSLSGAPVAERAVYTPTGAGSFYVQVGAFSDPTNAQRVRDAVSSAGPVVVDTRSTASGGELFRVRVGPYASREEADGARRTLSTLGYADSVVAAR